MAHLALWVLCAAISFPGQCLGAANPPAGDCCHFKLGGRSRVHFYVCCNNCDENGQNPGVCNKITYDGASKEPYCGDCGEDLGTAKFKSDPFDCGGCDGQTAVKAVCDKKYGWVFAGLCWVWSACFELRCQNRFPAVNRSSYDSGTFCGDGKCDPGETHYSCPFDCCPSYNPDECTHHCNKCTPLCCSEPGCCKG
ncbi:uncharacterized protein [Branchiostoma lanceolatum]|uniref:uncharacterized protein n=1 Tax=Branchiostoma lanceolatum TaxID=7740 RepID=UPI003452E0CA